jgi:TolB-like protein
MGDGLLIEFPSAVDAVRFALAVQEQIKAAEATHPPAERLLWRMAVHLGDVVVDGTDLVGDGVNIAARLQALAPVGGVLVSRTVRDHLKSDVQLKAAGAHRLRNIPDPVEVFEVVRGTSKSAARGIVPSVTWNTPARLGAAVTLVLALVLIAGTIWYHFSSDQHASSTVPAILVIPISSAQGQARWALLADGLTDEVIGSLTRFSSIRVMGRNTSNSLARASSALQELRERHGVSYIVRGAMHDAGERLRLNVELIDAQTGAIRWASRYEDDLSKAFQTVDEVVRSVVSNVAVKVSRAELDRARQKPPSDLSAYELTLRGRQLWQRPNREALLEAWGFFLKAAEVDPTYAPPLAYAAFTHLTAFNNAWSDEFAKPAALERMLELSSKALDLDPSYALAYAAQAIAYTYQGRHDQADAAVNQALRANPNDPDVLGRAGQVQSFSGKHQQAIETLKRAIDLDPYGPAQWFNFLSRAYFFLGDDAAAIGAARTCLERSKIQPCQETLVAALALSNQQEQAHLGWKEISAGSTVSPEKRVERLRPAFRNQADLNRLVEGLTRAAASGS